MIRVRNGKFPVIKIKNQAKKYMESQLKTIPMDLKSINRQ